MSKGHGRLPMGLFLEKVAVMGKQSKSMNALLSRARLAILTIAFLAAWADPSLPRLAAQEKKTQLLFSENPTKFEPAQSIRLTQEKDNTSKLWLRPNTEQKLYLYARNPTD